MLGLSPWRRASARRRRPYWDEQQVGVVVSGETKVGGIRDICDRRKVDHLDFTEMLNAEGLSFGPMAAS
jgi:hypothetical protein